MARHLPEAEQKIVLRVVSKKGASPLDAVRKVNEERAERGDVAVHKPILGAVERSAAVKMYCGGRTS